MIHTAKNHSEKCSATQVSLEFCVIFVRPPITKQSTVLTREAMRRILQRIGIVFVVLMGSLASYGQITINWQLDDISMFDCDNNRSVTPNGPGNSRIDILDLEGMGCESCATTLTGADCDGSATGGMCGVGPAVVTGILDINELQQFSSFSANLSIDLTGPVDCPSGGLCSSDDSAFMSLMAVDIITGEDRPIGNEIGGCGSDARQNSSEPFSLNCNETVVVVILTKSNSASDGEGYVFSASITGSGPALDAGIPALGTETFALNPPTPCAGDNVTISLTNCTTCTVFNATDEFGSTTTGMSNSVTVLVPSSLTTMADFTLEYGNSSCTRELPFPIDLFPAVAPSIQLFVDPICLGQEIDLDAAITTLSTGLGINLIGNWTGSNIVSNIFNAMAEGTFPLRFTSTSCPGLVIDETILVDETAAGDCAPAVQAMPMDPRTSLPPQDFYCRASTVFLTATPDDCAMCIFEWIRQSDGQGFRAPNVGDPLTEVPLSDTDMDDIFTLDFSDDGGTNFNPVPGQVVLPKHRLLSTRENLCFGESLDLNQFIPTGAEGGTWAPTVVQLNMGIFNNNGFITAGTVSTVEYTPPGCSNSIPLDIEVRAIEDVRLPTGVGSRCDGDDINLATETPFSIVPPGGEWELNGTTLTSDLISLSSLDPSISPQVLEYVPTAGGCFENSIFQFNVASSIGTVQIFGDTINVNPALYCPGQDVVLNVPNLDQCTSCTFYWEELRNNEWNVIPDNMNTVRVVAGSNISLNTYRFTYTDECLGRPSEDTLTWILRPATNVILEAVDNIPNYCDFFRQDPASTSVQVFGNGEINGVQGTFSDPSGRNAVTANGMFNLSLLDVGENMFVFTDNTCSGSTDVTVEILANTQDGMVDPLPSFCSENVLFDLENTLLNMLAPSGNIVMVPPDQGGIDVIYSGSVIQSGTELLDLNQPPGIYTLDFRQALEINEPCVVGQLDIEILDLIDGFNNATICEQGNAINMRTELATGFVPAVDGTFMSTDGSADAAISGDLFDPTMVPPGAYSIEYLEPDEYVNCNLGSITFDITVEPVVANPILPLGMSYCEANNTMFNLSALISPLVGFTANGLFDIEDDMGNSVDPGATDIRPDVLGPGDYVVRFTPGDLNSNCQTYDYSFTIDAESANVLIVSDTTICQLNSLDLDTLIAEGPKTGTFTSVGMTIGIDAGNIITLPTSPGTFMFEYSVAGDGCQMAGQATFSINNVLPTVMAFDGGTICADTPPDDLNDIFFNGTGFTQVDGAYFLNDGINSPLALTDEMIDYSTLDGGVAYTVDFDVAEEAVDTGDGCINLRYTFDIEEKTASAGTAINGSSCPTVGVDLTSFITPDPASGIGTFRQISGDPIMLDAAATEMADFTDALPGDYVFEHIVQGTTNCPSLGDTTEFTVTIDAGVTLADMRLPVCEDATTVDVTPVCTDCSIIISVDGMAVTEADLQTINLGPILPGTSIDIPVEYITNTAGGVQCIETATVTVDVMMAGGTISDIVDAELCPGNTSFDLTTLSSVTGLVWYTSFDPANPADNQIATPETADLTGLTEVTAVISDPNCPVMATVNVIELSCPTLMIDPIEECRGTVIDLTTLDGASGVMWFVNFIAEGDAGNRTIDDPSAYTVESNTDIFAALGSGPTLDVQMVPVTSLDAAVIDYVQPDGEPACSFPLDNTFLFTIDVGDPAAFPLEPNPIMDIGSQSGSVWTFDDVDLSLGAFTLIFENASGCQTPFLVDPNDFGLDCTPAACVLATELTFDLVDDFVCSANDFPLDITITDADPNVMYNWLDRDGNVVLIDATTFTQIDTGLLQIQVVDRIDPSCMGIVDTTGILSIGGLNPISSFGGSCVQDSFQQQIIIPEYIGTSIVPSITMGIGRVELIDPDNGIVDISFATADNMSIEIDFPAPNAACNSIPLTITAPMECMADPGCVIPTTTFTTVPTEACTLADLPMITIDNPDPLFDYVWLDEDGAELDRGVTNFMQTTPGEITVRVELITDPTGCTDEVGTVGVTELGQIEMPMLFDEGCDPVAQDTFRASFIVPEYAGTGLEPMISFGNLDVVDANTGEFRVSFATDVQTTSDVTLEALITSCDNTNFTIDAGMPCMLDPGCVIPTTTFTTVPTEACTLADLPMITIDNPDPLFDYVWLDEDGVELDRGVTNFMQTVPGAITVRVELLTDPTGCTDEVGTVGVTELGQIEMPMLFDDGCDPVAQDTFRASFIVPEYAGTTQAPIITFGTGQIGKLDIVDAATGEFRVSFATDVQDFVDVSLVGATGCDNTDFVIAADMPCMVNPGCMITPPMFVFTPVCTAADFPATITIDNPDPDFNYVWLDEDGTELDPGATSFEQQMLGVLTVRVELLADPANCTAEFPTGVSLFGQVAEPIPFGVGCDPIEQDTFRASFTIPEYAGTTQVPMASFGTLELIDPTDATFTISFATDVQNSVDITLESLVPGCDATVFSITAGVTCPPDPTCPTIADPTGTVGECQPDNTYSTFFVMSELAGTGQTPEIVPVAGQTARIEDGPSPGQFRVFFTTDVQNFVEVTATTSPTCPVQTFRFVAQFLDPPTFDTIDPCDALPVTITINNPDADGEYVWLDTNGDSLDLGATFEQTSIGELFVRVGSLTDDGCTTTYPAPSILQAGSPAIPMLTSSGCDQDTFRASFTVPEFAGTGQVPSLSSTGNQNSRIEVIDAMAGEFTVSFVANTELEVTLELEGAAGCPSTSFPITAPMECSASMTCNLPDNPPSIIDILGGFYCDENSGPVFQPTNADFDPTVHGVRWFDFLGRPVFDGEQFTPTQVALYTATFFDLNNPMTCESAMSPPIDYSVVGDPFFTAQDFCFDSPVAAVPSNAGGSFSLNPQPTDGASIDAVTGEILGAVPGTTYTIQYLIARCNTMSRVDVQAINVPELSELTSACINGRTQWDVSFRTTGTDITWDAGGFGELCPATLVVPCDGEEFTISGIPLGQDITIFTRFDPSDMCAAELFVSAPDDVTDCTCAGAASDVILARNQVLYNFATCDPIPRVEADSIDRMMLNETIIDLAEALGEMTDTLKVLWYDVATGGTPLAIGNSFLPPGPGTYYAEEQWEVEPGMDCRSIRRTEVRVVEIPDLDPGVFYPPLCEANPIDPPIPNVAGGVFSFESNPSGASIDPATGLLTNLTVGETYVVRYDVSGNCPSFSDSTLVYIPALAMPTVSASQCNAAGDAVTIPVNTEGRVISARPGSVVFVSGNDYLIENVPLNTPVEIDVESPGDCGIIPFMISTGETCTTVDCPEPMFVTGTPSPFTFCEGDMVEIEIDTSGLGPDDVIEWYNAVEPVTGAPIGTPITTPSVMPTETAQFFVRIVNPMIGCESGLVSINVIENASLPATFDYDPTFCVGDVIEPNNFNTNPPAFNTNFDIERTDGTPVPTFFNSTGELLNAEPGEYVVTYSTFENANMCVDTMTQTFEVFDVPALPDTMFVLNTSTMLYSLEITTSDVVSDQTAGNLDLRPDGIWELTALVPGSVVMVTVENANGCTLVVDIIVPTLSACTTLPADPVVPAAIQSVCFAPDLSLDVSALGMVRIYENRDRTGLVTPADLTDFDPAMPDTFYVEAVDMDGCVSAMIDSIIILPIPTISDTSSVLDTMTGLTTFTFTSDGTPMVTPSTLTIVPDGSGGFEITDINQNIRVTISATNADGCVSEEVTFTTGQMMSSCPDPMIPAGLREFCVGDGSVNLSSLGSVTLYEDRNTTLEILGVDLGDFTVTGADTIYVRNACSGTESAGLDSIVFFANPVISNIDSSLDMTLGLYTLSFETDGVPQVLPAGTVINGPDANGVFSVSNIDPGTTLTIVSETANGCVSEDVMIQFPNVNQCPTAPVIDDLVTQHLVDANNVRQIEYCLSNVAGSLPPELEVMTDAANMVEWFEDPNGAPVATGITFQPMTPGTYFVRAFLAADCVGDFIQIELTENVGPDILNPGNLNPVCDISIGGYTIMIDSPDAVSINSIGGFGTVSGDAATGWIISGLPAGLSFQFEAIGADGCQTIGQLVIPSDSCVDCTPPPSAPVLIDAAQATISICTNEEFPTLVVADPPSGFFVEWLMDGQQVAMGSMYDLPANQMSGVIQAVITDGVSCSGSDSLDITLNIDQAPDAFVPYSMTNCLGDGTTPIEPIGAFEPGGTFGLIDAPASARISPSSGIVITMEPGNFSIEYSITDGNCTSIDTFNIVVDNPDTTFYNVVDFDIDAGTFGIEFGVNTGTVVTVPMGITLDESNDTFRIMDIPLMDAFDLTLESVISGCTRMIPVSFTLTGCPPIPSPVITSDNPFLFCENDTMSLITATAGPNEIIIWFDDLTGGQQIGRDAFNPQMAGITGTRTIYAEAIDMDTGCPSVMRSPVIVTALEFLEAGPDVDLGNLCFRDSIDLGNEIATIGNSRFEFNAAIVMNDVFRTENLQPDQMYTIDYIVDNATCGEDTAQIVIFLEDCRPPADFSADITNTLCDDTTDGAFTITVTMEQFDLYGYSFRNISDGVSRPIPINIDPNTLMGTVTDLMPGQYEVLAQDGADVRLRDTITIDSPAPLTLDIALVSQTTCNGDSDGSIRADVTGGTGPYIYDWNTGDDVALLSGLPEGVYEVTVTDANACTTDPEDIELLDADPISFENDVIAPGCPDQPDGQISFTNVVGGEPPLTFFLNNQASPSGVFNSLDIGTYFPSVEDARGCRVNGDEIVISSFAGGNRIALDDEAFANPGELVTIPLAINFTPLSIEWVGQGLSCTDCLNPEFTMTDGFRFFDVTVTTETGCEFRADITYFPTPEPSIYIPNAITQSDNFSNDVTIRNDIFFPRVQEGVQGTMSVRIYDRWGSLVHEASSDLRDIETLGWDGQLNGRAVESSVFSYLVRIDLENRSEQVERTGVFRVFN